MGSRSGWRSGLLAGAALAALAATPARAEVVRFEVLKIAPAFEGRSFGAVGAYEVVTARAVIAVDPANPRNAPIVDLERAPRDAAGRVEATAPVLILRPADPAKGNRTLLYDVNNRGRNLLLALFDDGPISNDLEAAKSAGNGFLLERGYTVAWSGWQFDAPRSAGQLALDAPRVQGLTGPSREEIVLDKAEAPFRHKLTYPAVEAEQAKARLTVRQEEDDARLVPPGLAFRFLAADEIEVTPAPGYDAGAIYELVYTARDPVVAGLSLASVRDVVAHLRSGRAGDGLANPLARDGRPTVDRAIGFGISQSGRFIKDLLYQGFHVDEAGRPVFDAIWPHIAGARRGDFNHRFAQPGRYSRQHEDHTYRGDQFPFTYPVLTDPLSGRRDGILARCQAEGSCPLVVHTDTDTEAFQGRAGLVTTAPDGAPVLLPANVRAYYLAGVPHFTVAGGKAGATASCQAPSNPLHGGPVARALLVALETWMRDGTPPPSTRFPSLPDGTLIPADQAAAAYGPLPGLGFAGAVNRVRLLDHAAVPPAEGPAYPLWLPRPDEDGHALGAVRLPQVEAPRANYLGWNLRRAGFAPGALCGLTGATLPLAADAASRPPGDPRRPLAERYPSEEAYLAAVRQAAARLVADRLLLPADAAVLVAKAERRELAGLP